MTTCKQYCDRDIHFFDRADKDALSDDASNGIWTINNLLAAYRVRRDSGLFVESITT
jgi:hypothetical protein